MNKIPKVDTKGKTKEEIRKEQEKINFMDYFDNNTMDSVTNLINLTIDKTYPNKKEEDDAWAMENAMLLLPKIIEMCSPKQTREESRKEELAEKINQLKG
jgi:hypothetical protein